MPFSLAFASLALCYIFAVAFFFLQPIVTIPVLAFLIPTLLAYRHNISFVYISDAQTGGLYHLTALRWLSLSLAFQPLLLGAFLQAWSHERLAIACFVVATAVCCLVLVHDYLIVQKAICGSKLDDITKQCLAGFTRLAQCGAKYLSETEALLPPTGFLEAPTPRASFSSASDFVTARMQLQERSSLALPLDCELFPFFCVHRCSACLSVHYLCHAAEIIDDLTNTHEVIRLRHDTAPHLPSFTLFGKEDYRNTSERPAYDQSKVLYPPWIIAPPPVVWLPNDEAQVALGEAKEMRRYWKLDAIVDAPTFSRKQQQEEEEE